MCTRFSWKCSALSLSSSLPLFLSFCLSLSVSLSLSVLSLSPTCWLATASSPEVRQAQGLLPRPLPPPAQFSLYHWLEHRHTTGLPTTHLLFWGQCYNWLASVNVLWIAEIASLIFRFYLSVTACKYFKFKADLSLRLKVAWCSYIKQPKINQFPSVCLSVDLSLPLSTYIYLYSLSLALYCLITSAQGLRPPPPSPCPTPCLVLPLTWT